LEVPKISSSTVELERGIAAGSQGGEDIGILKANEPDASPDN